MLNIESNNIIEPLEFKGKLHEIMRGIYELFELSREKELNSISDDGVIIYDEESGKTCFQVSGQYEDHLSFCKHS
jgi:hypothetical protein